MGASESAPAAYTEDEDKGIEAPERRIESSLKGMKPIRKLADVEQLRADLEPTGKLYLPEDDQYEELRKQGTWNLAAMGRPSGIVLAAAAADVIAAVRYAAAQGIELSIAAARKSHLCVIDDALMLDLSSLKTVTVLQTVSSSENVATVGAGVTWRELDRACAPYGLAVTGSYDPEAGVIGSALHGGHGFLARKHGLLADNILSAEIVLVTGEIVEAAADHNQDLFWAIRGGSGNFGVVLKMRIRLHTLPNKADLVCTTMSKEPMTLGIWPWQSRLKMLDEYFQLCSEAPDEFTANLDVAGAGTVTQVNLWLGEEEDGIDYFLDRKEEGKYAFLSGEPGVRNYHLDIQRQALTLPSASLQPTHAFIKRAFVNSNYPTIARALDTAASKCPNTKCGIRVYLLGGAISSVALNASAVAHRHAKHLVEIRGLWEEEEGGEEGVGGQIVTWVHDTYSEILPLAVGSLAQLPVPIDMVDAAEERIRRRGSPYGANLAKLRSIKAERDPTNVFRCNDNILGENFMSSSLTNVEIRKWQIHPDIPGPLPHQQLDPTRTTSM